MELINGKLIDINVRKQSTTVRSARVMLGYFVKQVSQTLNIPRSTLYRYERDPGSMYPSEAIELARFYGTTIDALSFS
jgi:DNA-binding XRE family transcriptional regulator